MEKFILAVRNRSGQILMESLFLAVFMSVLLLVFGKLVELQRARHSQYSYTKTTEYTNVQK